MYATELAELKKDDFLGSFSFINAANFGNACGALVVTETPSSAPSPLGRRVQGNQIAATALIQPDGVDTVDYETKKPDSTAVG